MIQFKIKIVYKNQININFIKVKNNDIGLMCNQ